jgi:hypothetical protein
MKVRVMPRRGRRSSGTERIPRRGQAVDVALASGGNRAHASAVPFPIAVKANGYWASVEIVSDSGREFEIVFGGFQPAERVEIVMQFKGDRSVKTLEASSSGEVAFPVTFDPDNKGTANAAATGSAGTVVIEYNVGKKALARR